MACGKVLEKRAGENEGHICSTPHCTGQFSLEIKETSEMTFQLSGKI